MATDGKTVAKNQAFRPLRVRKRVNMLNFDSGRDSGGRDARVIPPVVRMGDDHPSREAHADRAALGHQLRSSSEHSPGAGEHFGDEMKVVS
jgi:hypothetical protein